MEAADAEELLEEMFHSRAIVREPQCPKRPRIRPVGFPLQTLVLNLTNQCNLSCQYCYEFGEDKVATPEGKPKFMDFETARASVDYLLAQSAGRRTIHITFFGGETLMNFPLLQQVVTTPRSRPPRRDDHRFQPHHQRHAAHSGDHRVSVGEPHRRDREHGRAQGNARQAARVRQRPRQLRHHRAEVRGCSRAPTRPIAARVTLTSGRHATCCASIAT